MDQWNNLLRLLKVFTPCSNLSDKAVWRFTPTGDYSAVSFCKAFYGSSRDEHRHWNLVWSGLAPPKVEIFV
ncbi:hypothetical protein COLO4_34345 [Corchorus olitorius]|uniref:Uncharacterized protein n=1 Tax=Corchorus olitorius TaxID=93759 RepID=A0A1R3GLK5_9ROSI|nr:hypothetical protein COLO4_34345 [Corchorus olitorius]